jgi:hypothetical protein
MGGCKRELPMNEILDRIRRATMIECRSCNPDDRRRRSVPALHTLEAPAPADALRDIPSAEYRAFLRLANGARFFHTDDYDGQMFSNGLRVFGIEESVQTRWELLDLLRQGADSRPDEFSDLQRSADVDLQLWYEGFVPVAAPESSGDVIVLDTFRASPGAEPLILFLDHEYYYGGPIEPQYVDWQWQSFAVFLRDFAANPVRLLESNWRIYEGDGINQFYPDRVTYDE